MHQSSYPMIPNKICLNFGKNGIYFEWKCIQIYYSSISFYFELYKYHAVKIVLFSNLIYIRDFCAYKPDLSC